METVLICLLLLYNAWLVTYILLGRQQKSSSQAEEKPPAKPPQKGDDIVGKRKCHRLPYRSHKLPKRMKVRKLRILQLLLPTIRAKHLRHGYLTMSWTKRSPIFVSKTFRWNMRTMKKENGHRLNGMPPERALRKSAMR